MHGIRSAGPRTRRRRALVVVQTAVMLVVLFGFAAFTIDIGMLFRARAELQSAADSAAMAAASAYATDAMLQVRVSDDTAAFLEVVSSLTDRANVYAGFNDTLGSPTLIETADIATGWIDVGSATSVIDTTVLPGEHNAVHVMVRREEGGGTGANGPVEFLFGVILRAPVGETSASAVAVFNDLFSGYDLGSEGGAGALPITVHEEVFEDGLTNGPDAYSYDSDAGQVWAYPDGISEVNLYPYNMVPGNFGLLNIGSPNQGVPALSDQIENGVSPADMEAEVGTSELSFYNDDGSSNTYQITGDPGMKSALKAALEERIGNVVAFFLHDAVAGTGSNSEYQIANMRFGRVMMVRLTGSPSQRGLWIQPVSYNGAGVRVGGGAPSSDGLVGRLMLAR